jgi:chromate transport protein ChrA
MRRATLHLVLGVALVDTIALIGYYAAIVHAPDRTKMIFTGVWTVLTALVVAVLLKRVRRARQRL